MGIGERREHTDEPPPAERIHAIHRYDICPVCDGDGWHRDAAAWAWHTCPRCGGLGVVRSVVAPTARQEDRTT